MTAPIHPQLTEMLDAAALFEAATPEEFRAMRADYVEAAIRLGGALDPVDRGQAVTLNMPCGGTTKKPKPPKPPKPPKGGGR